MKNDKTDWDKRIGLPEGINLDKDKRKGEFGGTCNLSRCKTNLPATWYNYGTRNYYCRSCAAELNADEYNRRDALRLFGHELCIEGEAESH